MIPSCRLPDAGTSPRLTRALCKPAPFVVSIMYREQSDCLSTTTIATATATTHTSSRSSAAHLHAATSIYSHTTAGFWNGIFGCGTSTRAAMGRQHRARRGVSSSVHDGTRKRAPNPPRPMQRTVVSPEIFPGRFPKDAELSHFPNLVLCPLTDSYCLAGNGDSAPFVHGCQ
jgi:hypothetical protein